MPRRQPERGCELQPPVTQRQPCHAANSQSVRQRCREAKGVIFELVYRRSYPVWGIKQTIGAIADRQCRLIWKILRDGVRYEERGPAVSKASKQRSAWRMIRELRSLGYRVEFENPQQPNPAGREDFLA